MQPLSRNAPRPPQVLLQHSFVTTGRVGGRVSAAALEHCGCEVSFSSTVALSRHPGLGPPAGDGRRAADFATDAAHAGPVDAVAVGYAGGRAAFDDLADFAAAQTRPVFVDPILGRRPRGLYVPIDAPPAAGRLVAAADVVTPNVFELEILTGRAVGDAAALACAAAALRMRLNPNAARIVVAKYVDENAQRGLIHVCGATTATIATPLAPGRWRGTGDLFFGLLVGGTLARARTPDFDAVAAAAEDAAQWIAAGLKGVEQGGDLPLDALLRTLDAARQRHRKIGIAPPPCGSAATDHPASDSAPRSPARSKSLK